MIVILSLYNACAISEHKHAATSNAVAFARACFLSKKEEWIILLYP